MVYSPFLTCILQSRFCLFQRNIPALVWTPNMSHSKQNTSRQKCIRANHTNGYSINPPTDSIHFECSYNEKEHLKMKALKGLFTWIFFLSALIDTFFFFSRSLWWKKEWSILGPEGHYCILIPCMLNGNSTLISWTERPCWSCCPSKRSKSSPSPAFSECLILNAKHLWSDILVRETFIVVSYL